MAVLHLDKAERGGGLRTILETMSSRDDELAEEEPLASPSSPESTGFRTGRALDDGREVPRRRDFARPAPGARSPSKSNWARERRNPA